MLNFFIYFFVFFFGLAAGSFLNCLIHRLPSGEGFLISRSYCLYCKHKLVFTDLIPVLSFLILKGKCRYCQKIISWQYPLVELAAGILFLLPLIGRDSILTSWPDLFFYWIFTSFLIIIFVYDLKHYIIPDKIIYPAIVLAFLYNIHQLSIDNQQLVINNFLAALGAAAFFLIVFLASQGKWVGMGDAKLAFLMGLILGFPNILVALFLAFFLGAIIGIGLVISGKRTLKSEVPFGPFLVTGTFLALFFGKEIINWYLNLL